MGYSKESERQNKALADLMSGKEHTKDYIQVGYEGKQENLGGKTRESDISKELQSARMPWFCPSCKKAMKKKLDRKFWRTKGHCFDCQIEIENKMKINGEFMANSKVGACSTMSTAFNTGSSFLNPMNVLTKNVFGGRVSCFLAPGARNSAFWTSDSDSMQNSTPRTGF